MTPHDHVDEILQLRGVVMAKFFGGDAQRSDLGTQLFRDLTSLCLSERHLSTKLTVALRCFRILFGRLSFGSGKLRTESRYLKLMLWFRFLDAFDEIRKLLLLGLAFGNSALAFIFQIFLECARLFEAIACNCDELLL